MAFVKKSALACRPGIACLSTVAENNAVTAVTCEGDCLVKNPVRACVGREWFTSEALASLRMRNRELAALDAD